MSSRLRRFMYLAAALAVVVAASGAAGFVWVFLRPQAQRSGTLAAPVAGPVHIARDKYGVPHVSADSIDDALFAQGFVHAQDRLFQMDLTRRQAAGELAEVFGSSALASDMAMRRLRMRRLAEMHTRDLPGDERHDLGAYTRGVNSFIDRHRSRLPAEFTWLRYRPAPWAETDCLLAALSMTLGMTNTWRDELTKEALIGAGDKGKVEMLYPDRDGGEFLPGSNAWAVSGRFTASGKPLLANDPHLSLGLPVLWYANHLQAPGLDVTGISFPGLPGVISGHNARIAWGITNLQFDVQDLYATSVNALGTADLPADAVRIEEETVRVRNGPPVSFAVRSTRHGPVFQTDGPRQLALRWTASERGFRLPLRALNQAATWQQFRAAVSVWRDPPQNFVYADVEGNIGYQVGGRLPIRNGHRGDLPADGDTARHEWAGMIPFSALPSSFNPATGAVVTSNQNPFPADSRYPVHGSFAPHYRAQQIRARLTGRTALQPADMMAIQRDIYSPSLHFLAGEVVRALARTKPASPLMADAARLLTQWDGQMEASGAAPLIMLLVDERVRAAVADRAAPGRGAAYDSQMAPAAIEWLLRERPSAWFPDYKEMLARAAVAAVDAGAKVHGSDPARWRLGNAQQARLANPIFGGMSILVGWLGRWTRIPPTGLSGSLTSVNQVTSRLAPSMRMVVDLGALDASLLTLSTGQSGQMLSPHYKDQWDSYVRGVGIPMRFSTLDAADVLTLMPR